MSYYDDVDLVALFKDASPEDKAHMLTNMTLIHIHTIQGYAAIIKKQIEESNVEGLPEGFMDWVDKIIIAASDLRKIRDAAVGLDYTVQINRQPPDSDKLK